MKLSLLLLFITPLVIWSCTTSEPASGELETVRLPANVYAERGTEQSLADFLRHTPGVNVFGTGDNVKVHIRGISTIRGADEPLFVIDGQIAGHSYHEANQRVTPRQIDRVRILKGSDAASYGIRGGNGVVVIYTKK